MTSSSVLLYRLHSSEMNVEVSLIYRSPAAQIRSNNFVVADSLQFIGRGHRAQYDLASDVVSYQ